MKKTILFVVLLTTAFFAQAQHCVLLDFQIGDDVTAEEVEAVSYEFRSTFHPSCYTVEDHLRVIRILKDRGFDVSAMKKEQIRKLGRDMTANIVVYGSLSKYMDEYTLDVNVMDVSTGTTLVNQNNTFQKSEYRTHTRKVSDGIVSKLCRTSPNTSSSDTATTTTSMTTITTAKPTVPKGYTDLGLSSGTLWKNENAKRFYSFDDAVRKFGNRLPTAEQWEELKTECQWTWNGYGYKVTGPNGSSIVLPAAGGRDCDGDDDYMSYGCYWSSTPYLSSFGLYLNFDLGNILMYYGSRCLGRSVRLVQSK